MDPKLKIISDHLRSSCFLIADGVSPSNEGRGYVLRRIMRRAMLQLHKLGTKEAAMHQFVDILVEKMGDAFPEIKTAKATIKDILKNEETQFRKTLDKGLKILESEINDNEKLFSGKTAFKLYDTYGFPLDLTQDILKEKNIAVNEAEFETEMAKQKEMARKNWSGSGESGHDKMFFKLKEQFGETKFLGYNQLEAKAQILYNNNQQNPFVILDQTSFYATSGGQKGDEGKIILQDNEEIFLEVIETKKFAGELFIHFIEDTRYLSNFQAGAKVITKVDEETRNQKAQNHSATHLMHKALKDVLGETISQKGSNVDAKYFTFDFNFNRAMTSEEIQKVEDLVNLAIKENDEVKTLLMPLQNAKESGAEALFGEKYDDEVRVVKMANSIELCGGTHVKNTADIEAFKIISEKSIASGIRRIEAKTGLGLKEYLQEESEKTKGLILDLLNKIEIKNQEISTLLQKEIKEDYQNETNLKTLEEILKNKDKEIAKLRKESLLKDLENVNAEKIADINFISKVFENVEAKDIRDITTQLKTKNEYQNSTVFAIFGSNENKVSACIALSNDICDKFDANNLIKIAVEKVGGKGGGGKKDLAMGGGNNPNGITSAIEEIKNKLK